MCQGLGPKKHDEISEIDRTCALLTGSTGSITKYNNNQSNNINTNNVNMT